MKISLIVAMDENRGIGIDNQLPWRLSTDLKRFKRLTMGHHLVIGRKTYQSIGRPLPGRRIIVLSRNASIEIDGVEVAASLSQAIEMARSRSENKLFIGGGAEVFHEALQIADRIYLTVVHTKVGADVFFPDIDLSEWKVIDSAEIDQDRQNQFKTTYKVLDVAMAV